MARRNGEADQDMRHGSESSSNGSWKSYETVRQDQGPSEPRATSMLPQTRQNARPVPTSRKSSSVLPERTSSKYLSASKEPSPMEMRHPGGFGNHRKALSVLGAGDQPVSTPTITEKFPSPHPGNIRHNHESLGSSSTTPGDMPGSFLEDSEAEQPSSLQTPSSRPGFATSPDMIYEEDRRRPSVASATTESSQGSKTSQRGRFQKKLQGFFGDDRNTSDSQLDLERTSSKTPSVSSRNRSKDIPNYGDAPVHEDPTELDQRYPSFSEKSGSSKGSRRLLLPHHRHSRSKEDKHLPNELGVSRVASERDFNPASGLRSPATAMSSTTTLGGRSASPTPSAQNGSQQEIQGQRSPGGPPAKRSLLDKLKRPHHRPHISALKSLPSSTRSLQEPNKGPKFLKRETSPRRSRNGSFEGTVPGKTFENVDYERKKGPSKLRHHRFPFGHDSTTNKDNDKARRGGFEQDRIWALDTDLSNLDDIVTEPRPLSPTDSGGIYTGAPLPEQKERELKHPLDASLSGDWRAPESWAVKKVGDDVVGRLPELPDDDRDLAIEDKGPYCIRIFRIDSTFATLSLGLNTTVTDVLETLGRKSFLQEDLNNYEIVLRKNDLSRTLDHGERPVLMQKRMLEQAGYHPSDRIADIGREDNSYLCRFTFLPTKLSGYSSLDVDPGFPKNHKFSHVDLQGRSLVTIPIMLYKKSSEIISLNLSRNLALDVPKDFVQSCVNLREIKYTGNEAWRLPGSFNLAAKLTYLDISNNLLEQLEHAELHRLQGLVSLRMANNKLSSLPAYFGNFTQLRSLNISSNYFTELPDFLHNLKSLVDLDISFNRITELPDIGRLKTLERLWVTNNALRGPLGETFTNLTNLKEIDARFNGITNIDSVCELPRLEQLLIGHNGVTNFSGTFPRLRQLVLDHCPVTEFDLPVPVPTLISVNIASAKLVQFKDTLFGNMPNLTKLNLNKNHFVALSPFIGTLKKLENLSIAKNPLASIPSTIGCLTELKVLNLRECNLTKLPSELWFCSKLEILNVSSNLLDSFPKASGVPPTLPTELQTNGTPVSTPGLSTSPSFEELGKLEDFDARRPSHASSSMLSLGSSPGSHRKGSAASLHGPGGRKASVASRATDTSSSSRKDSTFSQRLVNTFAGSLRNLSLADNRLDDDIFRQLAMIIELRVLNLSYNELTEFPPGLLRRWHYLVELYLSGNELTSLPSDDLEESSNLKVLHINVNKFQVLPAELCKVNRLAILDVGSNSLKYNVSNWPYDWNWNWNHNLKYLNFSGNKRFEIRPTTSYTSPANTFNGTDLTNFNSLDHLRVLGLMDVTLTTPTIPDQTEDRRVRTSASLSGTIAYGMADTLGKTEHLSMIDMVVPGFRGNQMETLIGLFDGQASSEGGSKVAKYLHENFTTTFNNELKRLRENNAESPEDALRRTFLALNKDMATATLKTIDEREHHRRDPPSGGANQLTREDGHSGGVATILYLQNMDLFCANVGDAQSVLVQTNGQFRYLTRNHDPAETEERDRIREAGGFVSRNGKLNDKLSVSRAFGYYNMMPAVIAAPDCTKVTLTAQDEMIILASGELWNFVTADVVVDVARAEREDLMIASQKLRDLAIAYGATNKIMVMIAGVTDLKRRERNKIRSTSLSMGPTADDIFPTTKRVKRPKDAPSDSRLARLDRVEPPTGELAIIFTDIKRSTSLWETYPVAMRSAIQIHNDLFRRNLSAFGGYEVKTEGDAFMVSFSTATAALLWCFNCQTLLLDAPWPTEILETPPGREQYDDEGNLIYRGLSVRMGVHWGTPVCEKDPITGRMDYFGPMVNRASRISAVADGGQIFVSSDFISEIQRNLVVFADYERSSSTGSEDTFVEDFFHRDIRRDLHQLSSQGFEVKDLGERKLKGLENPEFVYLMYPHALGGRQFAPHDMSDHAETLPIKLGKDSRLNIEADLVWRLWRVSLRLEAFCSALENPGAKMLKEPDTGVLNSIINRGGDLTDAAVLALVEHQVTRIELCASNLTVRHMMRPFRPGDQIQDHAIPMADILRELQVQLAEFRALKEQISLDSSGSVSRVGADESTPRMAPKALPEITSSLDESPMRTMYDENGLLV